MGQSFFSGKEMFWVGEGGAEEKRKEFFLREKSILILPQVSGKQKKIARSQVEDAKSMMLQKRMSEGIISEK